MNDKSWFTYIIATDDGQLYTGITTNITRRWQQHSTGKGARYFRGRNPFCLCYLEIQENRSTASKREAFIKSLTRKEKWDLIHLEWIKTKNLMLDQDIPLYDPKTPFV
jgi:putative endonuclease